MVKVIVSGHFAKLIIVIIDNELKENECIIFSGALIMKQQTKRNMMKQIESVFEKKKIS